MNMKLFKNIYDRRVDLFKVSKICFDLKINIGLAFERDYA
jgi:hypothetical protein